MSASVIAAPRSRSRSPAKHDKIIAALSALNGAALDKELGAEKAKPLAAKFDTAWPHLFSTK